jgi:hypothetical protein
MSEGVELSVPTEWSSRQWRSLKQNDGWAILKENLIFYSKSYHLLTISHYSILLLS